VQPLARAGALSASQVGWLVRRGPTPGPQARSTARPGRSAPPRPPRSLALVAAPCAGRDAPQPHAWCSLLKAPPREKQRAIRSCPRAPDLARTTNTLRRRRLARGAVQGARPSFLPASQLARRAGRRASGCRGRTPECACLHEGLLYTSYGTCSVLAGSLQPRSLRLSGLAATLDSEVQREHRVEIAADPSLLRLGYWLAAAPFR
jgi:hypothetical protein